MDNQGDLGLLLKTGLPLMGNVFKPLTKSDLIPLGLTAVVAAVATNVAFIKKNVWIRCYNINNYE